MINLQISIQEIEYLEYLINQSQSDDLIVLLGVVKKLRQLVVERQRREMLLCSIEEMK